jgi:hypothetical protein
MKVRTRGEQPKKLERKKKKRKDEKQTQDPLFHPLI